MYNLYISESIYQNPKTAPFIIFNCSSYANPIRDPSVKNSRKIIPIFIIDSGASLPMCYQSEAFSELYPYHTFFFFFFLILAWLSY